MTRNEIVARMLDPGIIAIIRADSGDQLLDAARALADGGIRAMEVTMTTPDALGVIQRVSAALGERILMGVGTVLDPETARLAMLAGARYVVTPVMRPDVIACCRRYSIPLVCGAYTPTEAFTAHEAGADFIKLFPADTLGPKYIRALLAPLPQLQIVPTGGVDLDTIGDFLKAGCPAVGVGGNLVSKAILQQRDWAALTGRARAFVEAAAAARGR